MANDTIEGFDLPLQTDASNVNGLLAELNARGGTVQVTITAVNQQMASANLADFDIAGILSGEGIVWDGAKFTRGLWVPASRQVVGGDGLTGGGALAVDQTISVDPTSTFNVAHNGVSVIAGNGLLGGGTIDANVTLSAEFGTTAGTICEGNDPRLAGGPPEAHAASHQTGGSDTVKHNSLTDYVADEHVAHSSVSIVAGNALSGGGTIAATRTLNVVNAANRAETANTPLVSTDDRVNLTTVNETGTSRNLTSVGDTEWFQFVAWRNTGEKTFNIFDGAAVAKRRTKGQNVEGGNLTLAFRPSYTVYGDTIIRAGESYEIIMEDATNAHVSKTFTSPNQYVRGNVETNAGGAAGALTVDAAGNYITASNAATSTAPASVLAMKSGTGVMDLLASGLVTNGGWTWTTGPGDAGLIYLGTNGALTQTRPTASGSQVQVVGFAVTATQIFFSPSMVLIGIA